MLFRAPASKRLLILRRDSHLVTKKNAMYRDKVIFHNLLCREMQYKWSRVMCMNYMVHEQDSVPSVNWESVFIYNIYNIPCSRSMLIVDKLPIKVAESRRDFKSFFWRVTAGSGKVLCCEST